MTLKIKSAPDRLKVVLSFREMRAIAARFIPYARRHWPAYVAGIVATCILNGTAIVQPYLLKILTDKVLVGGTLNFFLLHWILFALVGTSGIKGAFLYVQAYMMALGNQSTIRDLRDDIYRHLQMLPLAWFDKSRLGDTILRLTDDIRMVTELLAASIIILMNDTIVAVGSMIYMIVTSPLMTFLAFFLTPITVWLINMLDRSIERSLIASQGKISDLTSQLQETLSGIRVVKAFTRENFEIKRYCSSSSELFDVSVAMGRTMMMQSPLVDIISSLSIVIVIGYGAYAVANKHMTLGDFMAFWGYLLLASTPLTRLTNTIANLRRGLLAAQRVFEIKDIQSEVHDEPGAVMLAPTSLEIRFDNVTFGYNRNHPVLHDVTFRVPYGQLVAIVGHNGAGKSTLVALLTRFYDPQSGTISIDGHNVRKVRLDSLRRQIAFVLQENFLFSGTLRDNLKYGRIDATDEEMVEAAKAAHCHDFIVALPDGYSTRIVEGGRGLSGGQRQRIAIARALIARPRILVLDEATASLDLESERHVQHALSHLMAGRSTFVIAHRLSTVRRADLILVMEDGRIVESGTHEELLGISGVYCRLHRSFYCIGDEVEARDSPVEVGDSGLALLVDARANAASMTDQRGSSLLRES